MELDAEVERQLRFKAKALLRKRLRSVRASLPAAAAAERSARIVEKLTLHEALREARTVALFCAIEGRREVDLAALGARLTARGVRVAWPCLPPREGLEPGQVPEMSFRFGDPSALAERGWGFAEPPREAEQVTSLDVVVVPGLAFDERGHRIGYGAGFYDRALPRFCPPGRSLGVAFDFQLVAEVPDTEGDVPVDEVVTDRA
jgi:5-formyltetrahydrofolate cyclo-ligase